MEEDKKDDILFKISMQLYDEFNDKFCEINEHLGDVYTYKDLNDLEKAEKDKEIKLLREAIENLIARNKDLEKSYKLATEYKKEQYIPKSKVREKIEEEKDGIKRDLGNIMKIKDESWKKAIEQSINIRNRKIELCEELLQEGDK